MITVIKNSEVYTPEYLGKKDIIINGNTIEGIYENVQVPESFAEINIIDGKGKLAVPGFIDSHVHILGGGGEGGFKTRTPEIYISEIFDAGITTIVGCLGTDGVCRDLKSLLAKSRALDEEGVSTFIYTGSYDIPVHTITENIKSDIMLIDKIIGVGEIALSDNRSSQPTYEEFLKTVADSRVGGMLSGKAGIVNVHMGNGRGGFEYLNRMANDTEIPINQVIPTHIGRSRRLFEEGIKFTELGGIIDLTTSSDPNFLEEDEIKASKGLKELLDRGVNLEQIQFSSDGHGSLPLFNAKGEMIGLGIGSVRTLYREVRESILNDGVSLQDAIKVITSNVADHLKLIHKGRIMKDADADIVLLTKGELNIHSVISGGRAVMKDGNLLVRGTFENK